MTKLLKEAIALLQGKSVPHFIPGFFNVWTTAQSIQHCNSSVSPSLFLEVSAPQYGVNLTPQQVLAFMR